MWSSAFCIEQGLRRSGALCQVKASGAAKIFCVREVVCVQVPAETNLTHSRGGAVRLNKLVLLESAVAAPSGLSFSGPFFDRSSSSPASFLLGPRIFWHSQ